MSVVTRFPPSPTGILHIGNARTALFNFLFARHHNGFFLLRVEDTDQARSTQEAIDAIFDGLRWLGLIWDNTEIIYQSAKQTEYVNVAQTLLESGQAYRCYTSPNELEAMREQQRAAGQTIRYDGRWRDRDPNEAPPDRAATIRLKVPREGTTVLEDMIQGPITVAHAQLDDMILLRADGTPTYMLSVVVDDHDMGVTHILRGDDHLTNAFRQIQLYRALGWEVPVMGHMPLLHGSDGKKLSKRHGALGVADYRDMGYLPEAMCNYLTRLGWGHGDDEIFSIKQAIAWFDGRSIGRSPARLDFAKLDDVNKHYLHIAEDQRLVDLIAPLMAKALNLDTLPAIALSRVIQAMPGLKMRAKNLCDLCENALFLARSRPLPLEAKAAKLIDEVQVRHRLARLRNRLATLSEWSEANLEKETKDFVESEACKLGVVAQPMRAALTGQTTSPGLFEIMAVLGQSEVLGRLQDVLIEEAS